MNRHTSRVLVAAASLWLLALAGCGCKPGPDRHPVVVALGEGFQDQPVIVVNIVAQNRTDSPQWENYSMSRYWDPGDRMRESADKYVMNFGPGKPLTQRFSPKESPKDWERLWARWEARGATKLFILASLADDPANPFEEKQGSQDPRRRVLPLDRCKWSKKQQTIRCVLTPASIVVTTPPKSR